MQGVAICTVARFFLISSEIFTICKQNLILIFFAKLSVQLVPPITIITAVVILHKSFKAISAIDTILTLAGVLLIDSKLKLRQQ